MVHHLNFEVGSEGTTPLIQACKQGSRTIVNILLKSTTIEVNQTNSFGMNAVFYCILHGHLKLFEILLHNGGKCITLQNGSNVLHLASKKGFNHIVQYLIARKEELKIDLNKQKSNGMTAALLAARYNQVEVLRLLHKEGADLGIVIDDSKMDILYIASSNGNDQVVIYLLSNNLVSNPNWKVNANE